METQIKTRNRMRRSVVLIISLIFITIFSTLAVLVATRSGTNLQLAESHRKANYARASAESGLNVMRYLLSGISLPISVAPADRLATVAADLQARVDAAGMTGITVTFDGSQITIGSVSLCSETGQNFNAIISQTGDDTLQADVTGTAGQISRLIRTNFDFASRGNPIFDYGIATRGSLHMSGNVGLEMAVGSSVYIGGEGADDALTMQGNSRISGDVSINDPYASVSVAENSMIGGQSGQEAVDNHVFIGADAIDFPEPDVSLFEQYVQNVIDANTDTSSDLTLDNVRIAADINPNFTGSVTLRGIIFIEQPNIITFSGNATITGIVVGNGDVQAPSDLNQIVFSGSVNTYDVSELPDEDQFTELKDKTGSFLLAPGFSASFGCNASIANGAIAANGINFSGNAGGNVQGTIINYSQTSVSITGSSNLVLNPSGATNNPAGFTPVRVLEFVPDSYSEVASPSL